MLGLRRRQAPAGTRIDADLTGAVVHGPVAVGEHIVQIVAGDGAVVNYAAPEERVVPRPRPAPVRRLPRDFAGLLGREVEVQAAREALEAGGPLELTGAEGIGKSVLLRHLAHRAGDDSLVHASCAGLPADDVAQLLFESLYETDRAFVPSPAQLAEHLGGPRAAFLLDDVRLGREEVERLLGLAPACTFALAGEARVLFGEGTSLPLAPLEPGPALELFERGLGRELAGREREAAVAFCQSERRPLRVLQAADLVSRGAVTAQALPSADLDGLIQASLAEADRALLAPLAAVPGAAVPEAALGAAAGTSDPAPALDALEQRGLVQAHSPRWSLRAPAAITGAAAPDDPTRVLGSPDARARTLDALASWAEQRDDPAEVAEAAGAVLAGIEAATAAGEDRTALRLARAADAGLAVAGRWGAWGVALDRALDAARKLDEPREEAWALHQLGSRAMGRGERDAAAGALKAALSLRERLGDERGAAITRHNLDVLRGGPPADVSPNGSGGGPPRGLLITLAVAALVAGIIGISQAGDDSPDDPAGSEAAQTQTAPPGDDEDPATTPDEQPGGGDPGGGDPGGGETAQPGVATPAELPDAVDFGEQTVNERSEPRAVVATNTGTEPIDVSQARIEGSDQFNIVEDGCGRTLAPGDQCTVNVVFAPTDRRAFREPVTVTAQLVFDDTGTGDSGSVSLSGTAVPPAPGEPSEPSEGGPTTTDDVAPPAPPISPRSRPPG